MRRIWHGVAGVVVAVAVLSILGCWILRAWMIKGSTTHLIPDGYQGPVVVVYDDPDGVAPTRDEEGHDVYKIPPDGVLRLSTPSPEAGLYDVKYFYVRPDGSSYELPASIPHVADDKLLQVFAVVDVGSVLKGPDAKPRDPRTCKAYVVGVPVERDDWVWLREQATKRALGLPPDPAWMREHYVKR